MRKRILSTIAAGAAAVLMLSGFDSAMTVQELQEKSKAALAEVDSMWVVMNGSANANLSMKQNGENGASMDIPINGNCDMSYRFVVDPFQLEVDIQYSGEAMGQGMAGGTQMYLLENEDGTGMSYMDVFESGEDHWSASTLGTDEMKKMKDMMTAMLGGDISALDGMSDFNSSMDSAAMQEIVKKYQDQYTNLMKIAPQPAMKDDSECYELTMELSGNDMYQMLVDILSASGQTPDDASLQMVQAVVGGIRMKVDTLVDAQTFLPAYGTIDFSESDFSSIGNTIVESMGGTGGDMTASLDVSELGMTANFTFNEPVAVEVPEEAKAATQPTGESEIGIDLGGGIGGILTGGDDTGSDGTGSDDSDGAIQNPDGTYHLEYQAFDGTTRSADVTPPEGLRLSYGSKDYISFTNDDYSYDVIYSMFSGDTPQETVEANLDVSFMESDSSYTDVSRTEVKTTTLPDGREVCYGYKAYTYGGYKMGSTECAVQGPNSVVVVSIEKQDEQRNSIEASEQEIQSAAALVKTS